MIVGGNVIVPHRQMEVAPVITGEQAQTGMCDRMAIGAVENADGDGAVVDHWEVLNGAAHLNGMKKQWRAETESHRENSEPQRKRAHSVFGSLPMVLNSRHA